MQLGYNTNGLVHHHPLQAIELLADIGYGSVALTIDHGLCSPFEDDWRQQVDRLRRLLERLKMRSVVETGARYLLDPRRKHEPTLMSPLAADRTRRVEFLQHAIEVASLLGSDCVSLWSGVLLDHVDADVALNRLTAELELVVDSAVKKKVVLGFEPEPGMFIDTTASFRRLLQWIDVPELQLTMDVGHLYCQGEVPIRDYIHRWKDRIVNVHLEDMRAGVHEHLMFGEGEMDFRPILHAFREIGYQGGLHVELSRHSHEAPVIAQQAFDCLAKWMV